MPVVGDAKGPGFKSYKLESSVNGQIWTALNSGTAPVDNASLASWDTTALVQTATYSLRLTVTYQDGTVVQKLVTGLQADNLAAGWPQRITTSYIGDNYQSSSAPTLQDLDGDGQQEVLIAYTFAPSLLKQPALRIYSYTGALIREISIPNIRDLNKGPSILTKDGSKLILITGTGWRPIGTTSSSTPVGYLMAFKPDGTLLWTFSKSNAYFNQSSPLVADLNADSKDEVVLTSKNGELYLLDANGTLLADNPLQFGLLPKGKFYSSPVYLPTQKKLLVVERIQPASGSAYYKLHLLNLNSGTTISATTVTESSNWPITLSVGGDYPLSPLASDINGDNVPEILMPMGLRDGVYAYDLRGSLVSGWTGALVGKGSFSANVVAADLNSDSKAEVIVGIGKQLQVLKSDGQTLSAVWPKDVRSGQYGKVASVVVIGQGTGSSPAILVKTTDGYITGYGLDGAIIPSLSHRTESEIGILESSLAIGNLSGDNSTWIVGSSDYNLSFDGVRTNKGSVVVYAWKTALPSSANNLVWSTYKGNNQRTGSSGAIISGGGGGGVVSAPTLSISAPGVGRYSNSRQLTLTITGGNSRVTAMKFTDSQAAAWGAELPYATSTSYAISAKNGDKTIMASFKVDGVWTDPTKTNTLLIGIDDQAPITSATVASGPAGYSILTIGWGDNFSNVEPGKTYYSLDGSTPALTYTGPLQVKTGTTIKYFSIDRAGNREAVRSKLL